MAKTSFRREEIRNILGEACTDDIENRLIALHLGVVDPMKDELQKYKADAEKLADVQKQLDDLTGADWKGQFEQKRKELDDYKRDVENREAQGKVKSAYRAMLENDLHIDPADADLIMAGIDTGTMKLDGEGKLDGADALRKAAETKYARYIPEYRKEGHNPPNPPKDGGNGGDMSEVRALTAKWQAAKYGEAKKTE